MKLSKESRKELLEIGKNIPPQKNKNLYTNNAGSREKINQYIDLISNKINKIHQQFIEQNKSFSAIQIRDTYLGKNEKNRD